MPYDWKDTDNSRIKRARTGWTHPTEIGLGGFEKTKPLFVEAHNPRALPKGMFSIVIEDEFEGDDRIAEIKLSVTVSDDEIDGAIADLARRVAELAEVLTGVQLQPPPDTNADV